MTLGTSCVGTIGEAALERLRSHFGSRLKLLPHQRVLYGYDATGVSAVPDAVVAVGSVDDARFAVDVAITEHIPLVARGAGSGLSAGSVPEAGGIVLSFERMRRIGPVDTRRRRVWVEPGAVNRTLDSVLASTGLFYPPDPASHRVSTLGGNIAENSGGPRAVKYGVTGHHVAKLRVVDGQGFLGILEAGEVQPSCDLVSLVVGSEGTLALVLGAELKLERRPDYVVTMLVSFAEIEQATAYVSAVIARGIVPTTLEFMDRPTIAAIEAWGVAHYPAEAAAVLLIDLDGSRTRVHAESESLGQLAREMSALDVSIATEDADREALWLGRRGAYAAVGQYGKRILTQDITVPREVLTDMLIAIGQIAETYGLMIATVGHAGDGNLHPDFPYDPGDPEMSKRVHDANIDILRACVARGGSITGEHGIGSDKLQQLPLMYSPVELGLMADVRRALDPHGILNPGKAVPLAPRQAVNLSSPPPALPRTAEYVQAAILEARGTRLPVQLDLGAFSDVTTDLGNLTVEVGAGTPWTRLEEILADTAFTVPVTPIRENTVCRAVLMNDYGPTHVGFGTFRQTLLAATYVTGAGELVHMGRGVMKNVAGYDLVRLLIGSRGRLGVPLSFRFRLVPRQPRSWVRRPWAPDGDVPWLDQPRPTALVLLPGPEGFMAYAQFSDHVPPCWMEADAIEDQFSLVRRTMESVEDGFDLSAAPGLLLPLVRQLEHPVLLLPAAARVIARCDRATAEYLTAAIGRSGQTGMRSLWGPQREPLHELDPLTARWDHSLARVFDPDAILSLWLHGHEDPE